jgi:hypothetical protein
MTGYHELGRVGVIFFDLKKIIKDDKDHLDFSSVRMILIGLN